jgi:hypothetical protein
LIQINGLAIAVLSLVLGAFIVFAATLGWYSR